MVIIGMVLCGIILVNQMLVKVMIECRVGVRVSGAKPCTGPSHGTLTKRSTLDGPLALPIPPVLRVQGSTQPGELSNGYGLLLDE